MPTASGGQEIALVPRTEQLHPVEAPEPAVCPPSIQLAPPQLEPARRGAGAQRVAGNVPDKGLSAFDAGDFRPYRH